MRAPGHEGTLVTLANLATMEIAAALAGFVLLLLLIHVIVSESIEAMKRRVTVSADWATVIEPRLLDMMDRTLGQMTDCASVHVAEAT